MFKLLRAASEEELFHLENGLDITSVRELIIQLRLMDEETFRHHVTAQRNDFSVWIRDVFKDDWLADDIEHVTGKEEMAGRIERRLLEWERRELERFGADGASPDLQSIEETIEDLRTKGESDESIRDALLRQGYEKSIIELLIIGKRNHYREYYSLDRIADISRFHQELDQLKRTIINAVVDGSTLIDIKRFLHEQGWHDEIVDFVIYDVFKPHPNVRKVATYITYQLREKKRSIEEIRENLVRLGWKEFIIDSVIYGINEPGNSLQEILSYLEGFAKDDDQEKVKRFLLQLGWEELDINEAIRQREFEDITRHLQESFNLPGGSLIKEHCTIINSHLVLVGEQDREVWDLLLDQTRKVSLESFQETHGELHLENEYRYYYAKSDLSHVNAREGKSLKAGHFVSEEKPLLLEHKNCYLVLPRIIERECVACKKVLPINRMRQITLWDDARTHKVKKYVCEQHKNEMRSLFEETRIIQS